MFTTRSRKQYTGDALLKQQINDFIAEVTIAGEVPTDTLYAKYRPDDAMEYIGMKPKQDVGSEGEAGGSGEEGESGPASGGVPGAEHLGHEITFDGDPEGDEASISSQATTSVHEHLYYTMMHRNSRFNP